MPNRGDQRRDGKIFWALAASCKNGEHWVSPDVFSKKIKANRTSKVKQREYSERYCATSKFWDYMDRTLEHRRDRSRKYYHANKKKVALRIKNRYHSNPDFKVATNLRNRIRTGLKGIVRTSKTEILLGDTFSNVRKYIQSQFTEGMTWENHGAVWHIDHILPCAAFDLTDIDQQKKCFHWTNLQPLWARDNLIKNGKIL